MNQHPPERFATLSKALNAASDLLTSEIVNVESALSDLNLGLETWIEVGRSREVAISNDSKKTQYPLTRVLWLGYAKHGGRWGLVVEEVFEELEPDEVRNVVLLRDAKRDVRVEAADKIPALVEKIQLDAADAVREVAEKAQRLKDFAANLRTRTK